MYKKLLALILLINLVQIPVFADSIGNNINEKEYPDANSVLPNQNGESIVIEGSVEKNI